MAQDDIGVAVLGAGRIGGVHATNLARAVPGATLIGVADIDRGAAERVIATVGQGRAFAHPAEALADPAVQAVVIATPTDTHATLLAEAAHSGKHVFCEKPIALTLEATQAVIDDIQGSNVLIQLGFQRRFDPAYRRLREAIERGDIGEPWIVKLVGRDPQIAPLSYLRSSGGVFKDQAIHEFDAARWLSGREVEVVQAMGSVLVDPNVATIGDLDTALTTLRFAGGTLGLVDTCRQTSYGFDVRVEVHGSEGRLMLGDDGQTAATILEPKQAGSAQGAWFLERFAAAYHDELVSFVECVQIGQQPQVGVHDGLAALRIAVAAGRSARERRQVRIEDVTSG